jgi:hypothetical protein
MKQKSKASLFKELIKSAVREVIQEELRAVIREELKNNSKLLTEKAAPKRNYEQFLPNRSTASPASKIPPTFTVNETDPVKKMLALTAKSMTPQDFQNSKSSMIVEGPINQSMGMQMNPQMMESIGDIEEWTPTSINMHQFPG